MHHTLVDSTVHARLAFALVATIVAMPYPSQAQAGVTGKWLIRYEHEVRSGHLGSPLVSRIVTDTVHMTLRHKGDSIFGEWQPIASAGETPPSPRTLVGVLRGETARLEIDPNVAATEGYFAELGREIVEFMMMPAEDVVERVRTTDDFKFNVNLVILDFALRRGVLTPEDPEYLAAACGLHRPLD